jgi:predicted RND superfamily exporter protein
MTHFFEKRDRWGHGMALWVLLLMIFISPFAWWAIKQIDLQNDVRNWLPSSDPQARTLSWYQNQFNVEDRILASWKGSSLSDPRVEEFAQRLEGNPDNEGIRRNGLKQIQSVTTPNEVIQRMVEHKVEREEAIRRLNGVLIGSGGLKVRLSEAGKRNSRRTIKTLSQRVKERFGMDLEVEIHAAESQKWTAEFDNSSSGDAAETGERDSQTMASLTGGGELIPTYSEVRPFDFSVGWRGSHVDPDRTKQVRELMLAHRGRQTAAAPEGELLVEECFFIIGSPVAVSISLTEAGLADKSETLEAIRQTAAEVGINENDLHLGGRLVAGSELNNQVKKVAWNSLYPITHLHKRSPLLLSALVGIVLAFLMLRSFRLATLVLLVSAYTTLLAVAVVPVTNGSMNMVLVVMPTLLSVLTISAAIHVANYWKYAAHRNNRTAVVEAVMMARQPCILASVTTAIGLLSLTTSPLTPVRDFGLYSAIGCLVALVVVLYGFPSLLQFWPAKPPKSREVDRSDWKSLGNFLSNRRYPVILSCLAVFAVCTYGLKWFRTETKVIRYFPDEARIVQDYNFLEENLAGIVPVVTIVRFDDQAQHSLNFLQRMELVRNVQNKMRQHPQISGTMSLADFQPVSKRPPNNAGFLQKAKFNRRALEVETRARESDAAQTFLTSAEKPTDLYETGDQRLNKAGDELWQISAQVAIMSDMNYADFTADLDDMARSVLKTHAGSDHVVTGMVPLFLRTQQAVLDSLITSFTLAFAVIAVVMMVLLKNPIAGLVTMLPNLLPVGIVFGLISWNGLAVDIGTMITASVALGIAVDGTLHLITWFQIGIRQGLTRREAVAEALSHCGPAMWQTSTAVGLGLLMLYPADLLLIKRFGWLMSALIGTALVADVIFLPALLAGPLGSLIQKTLLRSESAAPKQLKREQEFGPQPVAVALARPYFSRAATQSRRFFRID